MKIQIIFYVFGWIVNQLSKAGTDAIPMPTKPNSWFLFGSIIKAWKGNGDETTQSPLCFAAFGSPPIRL
jgi:hypothetical protein